MKKTTFISGIITIAFTLLLFSNFNASAQKTNIWIVRDAETNDKGNLSNDGLQRAQDLLKALKHEKIQNIYITGQKSADQTVAPLAQKDKILPRVYADSIKAFVAKILRNFQGTNMLIVAQYDAIIPIIEEIGAKPPFEKVNDDDYDMLFSITLNDSNKRDLYISRFGKSHHSTDIPPEFILQNFYPNYVPPMNSH